MIKRLALSLGVGLLLSLSLGGCAQKAENPSGQITLEFWTLQLDAFKSTLEPMFLEYEHEHPNVRIKWVDVPFSEGSKRALTAMMSGHPPDVINLNPDFSAILANRHALINMQQALPEATQRQYVPVTWDAATLLKPSAPGKTEAITFGLPWYVTSSVTLYNQALLNKAGYTQPPATFDELPAFTEAIHAKTGAYGLMPTTAESGNFLKELKKKGIALYDANGKAMFANAMAIDLLTRYVDMYQSGTVPAEAITEGHQAAVGRYQAGTLAMFTIGPNFLKIVKENAPKIYEKTGVAPQFPQNSAYKDFSLMILVVPVKSAHPKEAVDFAAFITNAQNQLALAKAAPVLPSISSALKNPYFSEQAEGDRMAEGRAISARQLLEATEAYRIQPAQNAINEQVNHYVQLAMLGKLTPEQALKQAQQAINETLESGV